MAADKGLIDEFNCELHERTATEAGCFRHGETVLATLAVPVGDGRYMPDGKPPVRFSRKQVELYLAHLGQIDPKRHALDRCMDMRICPQGLLTNDLAEYIEKEMVCSTYSTPPVDGGLDEWPALLYQAFLVIRQTHEKIKGERAKEAMKKAKG